jgi:AcrR family transcriptional regulator
MSRWGREDEPAAAVERLLDAAREVFARKGVVEVTVADVAAAAGCARGTVYRCFPDRHALRAAFVDREARRVARRIGDRVAGSTDLPALLVESILAALDEVRADAVLAAWFTEQAAGTAGRVAIGASVIRQLVGSFLHDVLDQAARDGLDRPGADADVLADAVVRLVLSLLAHPADAGTDAERRLVEQVLLPAVFREPAAVSPPA